MTPELLTLLTPEQQEVWRIHGIASYMPSAYVSDALLELAQMKAALVEIYATATRTLADPPRDDMSALIMICTIFEALSAQKREENPTC